MRPAILVLAAIVALGTTSAMTRKDAASEVWVQVQPSTAPAGSGIHVKADCGEDMNPAKVRSEAFGEQLLLPDDGGLAADVTVPADTRPGTYTVKLTCPNGKTASTKLHVLAVNEPPAIGPHTGGGGTAGEPPKENHAIPFALVGGLASLVIGATLGLAAMRRRRPGLRA